MAHLYEITAKLDNFFNEIEEAGGEVTEEELKELECTEQDFKDKLTGYVNYINEIKNDIEKCKCEEKRIHDLRKVRENRIERIKNYILPAVEQFGIEGKTNKYIELPCARLSTRTTNTAETLDSRLEILYGCIHQYLILKYDENDTLDNVLDKVNDIAQTNFQLSMVDLFTLDDLKACTFTITKQYTVKDLINYNKGIIHDIKNENTSVLSEYTFKDINTNTDFKDFINAGMDITIASPIQKVGLMIK